MLVALQLDSFINVVSYLTVADTMRTLMTSKELYSLRDEPRLWKVFLQSMDNEILSSFRRQFSLARNLTTYPLSIKEEIEVARQCTLIKSIGRVQWYRSGYHSSTPQLEPMEGHTMNSLVGRFLIIVGGWGGEPPNQVSVIDGLAFPNKILPILTITENTPRFRYGFSTMVLRNRVFVYGGCRQGGYSADCNGDFP